MRAMRAIRTARSSRPTRAPTRRRGPRSIRTRCSSVRCTCRSSRRWCASLRVGPFGGLAEVNVLDIDATGSLHGQAAFPVPGIAVLGARGVDDRRHRDDRAPRHVAAPRLRRRLRRERAPRVACTRCRSSCGRMRSASRSRPRRSSCSTTAIRSRSCRSCRLLLRRRVPRARRRKSPHRKSANLGSKIRHGGCSYGHHHDEEPPPCCDRHHPPRPSAASSRTPRPRASSPRIPTSDQVADQAAERDRRSRSASSPTGTSPRAT